MHEDEQAGQAPDAPQQDQAAANAAANEAQSATGENPNVDHAAAYGGAQPTAQSGDGQAAQAAGQQDDAA